MVRERSEEYQIQGKPGVYDKPKFYNGKGTSELGIQLPAILRGLRTRWPSSLLVLSSAPIGSAIKRVLANPSFPRGLGTSKIFDKLLQW